MKITDRRGRVWTLIPTLRQIGPVMAVWQGPGVGIRRRFPSVAAARAALLGSVTP
jgi:hypothetical protein